MKRRYKKKNQRHGVADALMKQLNKPQKARDNSFKLPVRSVPHALTMLNLALLALAKSKRKHVENAFCHLAKKLDGQEKTHD